MPPQSHQATKIEAELQISRDIQNKPIRSRMTGKLAQSLNIC